MYLIQYNKGQRAVDIVQNWLGAEQPKIHFARTQQFMPVEVKTEMERDSSLNPYDSDVSLQALTNASEVVAQNFTLPFELYDYQKRPVDALARKDAAGVYLEVGAGKTVTGTVMALYHKLQSEQHTTIVVMPPILILQWSKFLSSIPELSKITRYEGTKAQRAKIDLDADFLLMSLDIFKNDFEKIYKFFENRDATLIVDEAVSIKNPNTIAHKVVRAFHENDIEPYLATKRKKDSPKIKHSVPGAKKKDTLSELAQLRKKLKELYNG